VRESPEKGKRIIQEGVESREEKEVIMMRGAERREEMKFEGRREYIE
jgi:hypothetical protein